MKLSRNNAHEKQPDYERPSQSVIQQSQSVIQPSDLQQVQPQSQPQTQTQTLQSEQKQ